MNQYLQVGHADGAESYLSFGGDLEHPEPGEVIFTDAAGEAHARRWTNRQSSLSAVQPTTTTVLIVSEALHDNAHEDQPRLLDELTTAIGQIWQRRPHRPPDRQHPTTRAVALTPSPGPSRSTFPLRHTPLPCRGLVMTLTQCWSVSPRWLEG